MPRIPDRWFDYSSVGKRIADTPFIALKTPLEVGFFRNTPDDQRFGPNDLKSLLPQLAMIIDLTNTYIYYNPKVLSDQKIEYRKIRCEGQRIPGTELLKKFFLTVDKFLQETKINDDVRLIGIHCTHGVNRTGFFICSYMISKLDYTFENAVKEFNLARGHSIERQNYLSQLKHFEKNPLTFTNDQNDIDIDDNFIGNQKPAEKQRNWRSRPPRELNEHLYYNSNYSANTRRYSHRDMNHEFRPRTYRNHDYSHSPVHPCWRAPPRYPNFSNFDSRGRNNYRNISLVRNHNNRAEVPPYQNISRFSDPSVRREPS